MAFTITLSGMTCRLRAVDFVSVSPNGMIVFEVLDSSGTVKRQHLWTIKSDDTVYDETGALVGSASAGTFSALSTVNTGLTSQLNAAGTAGKVPL